MGRNQHKIAQGNLEQIRNDIDNARYLIRKYGFMLNGNRTYYLYNSQPPFLSMMIRDYYEKTKDKNWLFEAYEDLRTEYDFWTKNRKNNIGLTNYDSMKLPEKMVKSAAKNFRERTGLCVKDDETAARALISAGESGWDMNPRMTDKTYQVAPADLNSLMYSMEENLSYFASELGIWGDAEKWKELSVERARLCRKYLKNSENIFMDYDFVEDRLTEVFSAACYYPLYCGMATEDEAKAARDNLSRLETEHGIITCEKTGIAGTYQWGYPNGWAPMQMIVVVGLLNYGYKEDASRIATKFVNLIEKCYNETGHLWEKYNVVDGSVNVRNETEMPAMLGWTYGVYVWFRKLLEE